MVAKAGGNNTPNKGEQGFKKSIAGKKAPKPTVANTKVVKTVKTGPSSPTVNLVEVAKLITTYTSPEFATYLKESGQLDDLARNGNTSVRKGVASNFNASPDTIDYLVETENVDHEVILAILNRNGMSLSNKANILLSNQLDSKESNRLGYSLLKDAKLDSSLIEILAGNDFDGIKTRYNDIETGRKFYESKQTKYAGESSANFYAELASHPNTTPELLHRLAIANLEGNEFWWKVREHVAENPKALTEDLIFIAGIEHRSYKGYVAKKALQKRTGKRNWKKALNIKD